MAYLRGMAKKIAAPKKSRVTGGPPRTSEPPQKGTGGFTQMIAAHPVRWAVIAYALLTIIFFAGPIFSPGKMIYGTDTMSAGVFFRTLSAEFWREHLRMPFWNPYIHAGLPFVDAMHGDIFYPAAILQIILPVTYAIGLKLILHVFLAGVFMFLFLRRIGRPDTSAFIAGILYMFAPCLVSLFYPGHDGKLYVAALTPLALLAVHGGVTSRRLGPFLGFGLIYALMILTAHVQMAYYAAWGISLYFIYLLWHEHRFGLRKIAAPVVFFGIAVLLALGTAAIQWMAPYQYIGHHSQRLQYAEGRGGFDWASSWSMHSEELLSEINPEFPGDNIQGGAEATYWGQNFFKLNSEAVGVVAVALAIVAVVAVRGPTVWFFFGLSLVTLLYAMGDSTPVFRLFFYFVPMVKKFRAPSMINFLFAISWIAMAARTLDVLLDRRTHGGVRRGLPGPLQVLTIIAAVYTGIALVSLVSGASLLTGWASIVGNPLTEGKAAAAVANASKVSAGFVIGALTLWALVGLMRWWRNGALSQPALVGALVVIAVLPLWRFDKRFVQTVDPRQFYSEQPILQAIEQHAPDQPYRVLNLPNTLPDNYLALHGIEELSASAMHGNHLLLFDNFVGRHDQRPALLTSPATMNLLNASLLISREPFADPGFEVVDQSAGLYLMKNNNAMPRAAVFYQYEVEADSGATLARLRTPDFPYRSRLILDQPIGAIAPVATDAEPIPFTPANVAEWDVDRFVVECKTERDGILWLSENYYPAWRATDESGGHLPIYRADYLFRAVPIRAGEHRITFQFHSEIFNTSVWLSLACFSILMVGLVWTRFSHRRD
jgi:hypothetical protein